MKYLSKILVFIPLGIELLFITIFQSKVSGFFWLIHIPLAVILAFIGIGILSKKKIVQQLGNILLVVLTVVLCINGYYDYFQWFSTIVGIILFIYFTFVSIVIKSKKIV